MRLLLLALLMCSYSTLKLTYGEINSLETIGKDCDNNGQLKVGSNPLQNESTNRWNNRRNRRNRKNRNNNNDRKINNNGYINKSKSNQTLVSDGTQQTPLNSKKQTIFYESLKINPKKIVAKSSLNEVHDVVHEESVLSDESSPKVQHKRYSHQSNITTLEVGVYSIAAVFGVAVLILVITCSVFALKLKYKNPPETVTTTITTCSTVGTAKRVATHPHVSNANEWVYLGKATLERNSSKQHTLLLPEKDFNGNFSDNSIGAKQTNDSNRLSGLSEISIRITSNPTAVKDFDKLSDKVNEECIFAEKHKIKRKMANMSLNGPPIPVRNSSRVNKFSTYTKRPSVPPHRYNNGSKINNLNEILNDSVFVPKPPTHSSRAPPVPPHQKKRNKNDINSKLYLDNPLRVDLPKNKTIDEWNKTKMDYKQWMHYFENLKESNA